MRRTAVTDPFPSPSPARGGEPEALAVPVARRRLLRLHLRQQGVTRLPERGEEQIAERARQNLHRRAAGSGRLEAEIALRQLEMGGAEDMKYLVKVGQLLGAVVERWVRLGIGVERDQRRLLACQRALEGIPQIGRRPQNSTEAR